MRIYTLILMEGDFTLSSCGKSAASGPAQTDDISPASGPVLRHNSFLHKE
ncbi:hypothetical protein [Paraflavitalea speifideaquila]|nr:hypothetical protein [Paraflavitalea speifideiaquila]